MKRLIKIMLMTFMIIILGGCTKSYDKLSYTTYNEYFNSKNEYIILDKSSDYDITTTRYLEAGNKDVQAYYIEFQKKDDAVNYVNSLYKNQKYYKLKEKDNYTYVKRTKGEYFKLYRVDNVIVNVVSDKKHKKEAKTILKDLGY